MVRLSIKQGLQFDICPIQGTECFQPETGGGAITYNTGLPDWLQFRCQIEGRPKSKHEAYVR